jgi:hypothetical protein
MMLPVYTCLHSYNWWSLCVGGKRKVLSVVPSLGTYIQRGVPYASPEGRDLGSHRFNLFEAVWNCWIFEQTKLAERDKVATASFLSFFGVRIYWTPVKSLPSVQTAICAWNSIHCTSNGFPLFLAFCSFVVESLISGGISRVLLVLHQTLGFPLFGYLLTEWRVYIHVRKLGLALKACSCIGYYLSMWCQYLMRFMWMFFLRRTLVNWMSESVNKFTWTDHWWASEVTSFSLYYLSLDLYKEVHELKL